MTKKIFISISLCLLLTTGCLPPSSSGGGGGGGDDSGSTTTPANVIGASGGTYTSQGYKIAVPANALTQAVSLSISPITSSTMQGASPTGGELMAAADFGPDGTTFAETATITVPLSSYQTPASTYDLYAYNSTNSTWEDALVDGTVASDGMSMSAQVTHLTDYGFFDNIITPDTTVPYTSDYNPSDSENDVSLATSIVLHVMDAGDGVNQSTIVMTVEGITVTPTITGTTADFTLTYEPATDFSSAQVVNVTVDADDLAGNSMTQDVYSFTCENVPVTDTTPPTTSGHNPANNATDVSLATSIVVHVMDAGDGVDQSTIVMTVEGITVTPTITGTTADFTLTYEPATDFAQGQEVNVTVDASDLATSPNAMTQASYSFTCLIDPWSDTGSMLNTRERHSATLLDDGTVLVAGGHYKAGGYLAACDIYDPVSGAWSATGSMNTSRDRFSATLLSNGKVLVAGGFKNNTTGAIADCELYDPTAGTWDTTASLSTVREYHTATILQDGTVMVAGGWTGSNYLDTCELYNTTSGTWSATDSMNTSRSNHTATLLTNGTVLVTGGYSSAGDLNSCEIFDPASETWETTGSMSDNREYHTATLLTNGTVLVAGGYAYNSDNVWYASSEIYDPVSGTWDTTASMNTGREYHTATLLKDGTVLVVGGTGNVWLESMASCEIYDPSSSAWSETITPLQEIRYGHSATLFDDDTVLVAGGWNSDLGFRSTCELYNYDIPTDTTPPVVADTAPADSDTNVPANIDIYFEVYDQVASDGSFYGVDKTTVTVTVEGTNAILNGVFQSGYGGTIIPDGIGGFYVTVNPDVDFPNSQVVDIVINADDLAPSANSMTQVTYSFTCAN